MQVVRLQGLVVLLHTGPYSRRYIRMMRMRFALEKTCLVDGSPANDPCADVSFLLGVAATHRSPSRHRYP